MTLPALATVEAFEERLGRTLGPTDSARAQAALEDASALVRSEAGKSWVTGTTLDSDVPDVVVTITLVVARRAFDNPAGVASSTIGNVSVNWGSGIYLTGDERRSLLTAVSAGGGMVSLDAQVPWSLQLGTYIDVVGSDKPIPFVEP